MLTQNRNLPFLISQMTRLSHIHTNIFSLRLLNFMRILLFHLLNITLSTKRGNEEVMWGSKHWWKANKESNLQEIYLHKVWSKHWSKTIAVWPLQISLDEKSWYQISTLSPILLYKGESVIILKLRQVFQKVLLSTFLGEGECAGKGDD